MAYEVWATAPGNLLATFATQAKALEAVRGALERHGRAYGGDLALAYENHRGHTHTIAEGERLVALALAAAAPSARTRGPSSRATPPRRSRVTVQPNTRLAERVAAKKGAPLSGRKRTRDAR